MDQFKRTKVIMLPTDKIVETRKGYYTNGLSLNNSKYDKSLGLFTSTDHLEIPNPQHLYIISNDEIKKNDWFLNIKTNAIGQHNGSRVLLFKEDKKIIATTDVSLSYLITKNERGSIEQHLPQPSQQFIEKYIESYNKDKVITEVLIEYENNKTNNKYYPHSSNKEFNDNWQLKVNPKDNIITIKKLKDSWNRNEVIELLRLFENNIEELMDSDDDDNMFTNINLDKWIEENL